MFIDFGRNNLKPDRKELIKKRLEAEMALKREKMRSTVVVFAPSREEKKDPWFMTSFL